MKKAESHGLAFRTEVELDGDSVTAPIADSYGKFGYGIYRWITSPIYRPISAAPEERDDGTHPTVNETIDVSVFKRWRADPAYRPANLVEWARRKKVDPAQVQTSVEAGNPQASVPDQ
jgi:hypothetical protein